jgi:hypothetical protein
MVGISPAMWQVYKNIINKAHDIFNKDIVTWRRLTTGLQPFGEDDVSNDSFEDIDLEVLITYNIFRTWPITQNTPEGILDRENIVLMFTKKYLLDLGYLNADGYFAFNPGRDTFIHHGQEYRAMGETPISQAYDDALHIYIILIRQKTPTGNSKY